MGLASDGGQRMTKNVFKATLGPCPKCGKTVLLPVHRAACCGCEAREAIAKRAGK